MRVRVRAWVRARARVRVRVRVLADAEAVLSRNAENLYLPYISPTPPLDLPYISL